MVVLGNCKEIVPEGHKSSSVETSHNSEKLDPSLGSLGINTTFNTALSAEIEIQTLSTWSGEVNVSQIATPLQPSGKQYDFNPSSEWMCYISLQLLK